MDNNTALFDGNKLRKAYEDFMRSFPTINKSSNDFLGFLLQLKEEYTPELQEEEIVDRERKAFAEGIGIGIAAQKEATATPHSVKDVEGLADNHWDIVCTNSENKYEAHRDGFREGYKAAQSSPIEESKTDDSFLVPNNSDAFREFLDLSKIKWEAVGYHC